MKHKFTPAFTLVELIVTITILAILWTIAFVSFNGYSRDARNSIRVSDIKAIQKLLDLNVVTFSSVPLPDDSTTITYSGGTAWHQWHFGVDAQAELKRISSVPIDPIFWNPYTYSVKNNQKWYQLASIIEWRSLFWSVPSPLSDTYALSNSEYQSYNLWNYIENDIIVRNAWNCHVIATPSIVLSDIPTGWILENNTPYNYSYSNSPHIANSYSGSIENTNTAAWFQNIEVYSQCTVDTLSDLQLYNAKLSTAYQQFADNNKYEELIFNSRSNKFMLRTAESFDERGIKVDSSILNELLDPSPLQIFSDTFTNTNGTQLVWSHNSDTSGSWLNIPGWTSSAYIITNNELRKSDSSTSKIYPRPNPDISSADYSVTFNIIDFGAGSISLYLRYLDNDNYYRLELRSNWYNTYRSTSVEGEEEISNSWSGITLGSEIVFSVEWENTRVTINGIPQWTILAGWIDGSGYPVIMLENAGAVIDNYTLNYK